MYHYSDLKRETLRNSAVEFPPPNWYRYGIPFISTYAQQLRESEFGELGKIDQLPEIIYGEGSGI